MIRTKIKMSDGSEYRVKETVEEIAAVKNSADDEFIKIRDYKSNSMVHINLKEILSVEPYSEPQFTAKWL